METALFMTNGGQSPIRTAYDRETQELLSSRLRLLPEVCCAMGENCPEYREVSYLFSTWGMLSLSREEIRSCFPNLKALFFAAGSVQGFARPFLAEGVRVFSAWAANAVPVSEYAASQIVLAGKGFFQASRLYQKRGRDAAYAHSATHRGNYGAKVGIIGAGMIGKLVIGRLKDCHLPVLVYDPYLPDEKAWELGVNKCELAELFSECQVISNHLPNNAETKGMLDYSLFSRMGRCATFINTGRGAQVVEEDLVRALSEEPGRTAVLDVTYPEPVETGHPFYTMENVVLTPHIAGSMGDEVARMGRYMAEEYLALASGEPLRYEVTEKMLETMA